jgi:sugar phosphate isomerase/epimerase
MDAMSYTRRDLGKIALATIPFARGQAKINSKFGGVQIGAITYSFRDSTNELDAIIKAMAQRGLGEAELTSDHAEAAAGAPMQARGSRAGNEDLRKWRLSVSMDKFKDIRKKFDTSGIDVQILCFNLNEAITDPEIDYAFRMAKALGVKAISSTTRVSVSKRVAPFADEHKMMIGFHGHDASQNPNEFATPESFATAMSYSKYHGVNLDIGHFTAANYDAVAYIKEHHARITNLHLKDRKKDHGPNMPWGQGDTPIKEVLLLLKKEKYPIPANIEYEYGKPGIDTMTEMSKCLQYCKDVLA